MKKKKIYCNSFVSFIDATISNFQIINNKLTENGDLINKGLFLMATSYFEYLLRNLLKEIIIQVPEKLDKKEFKLTKEQICEIASNGLGEIIDNEIYVLFYEGVEKQLYYLLKCFSINGIDEAFPKIINKISDIYLYRNILIHNSGKINKEFIKKVSVYTINEKAFTIIFDKQLLEHFLKDLIDFSKYIKQEIQNKFTEKKNETRIEKLKTLWNELFTSSLMDFESYWEIDYENDIIVKMKFPEYERSLSSGEKKYLDIWRHQFYDPYKITQMVLYSLNAEKIYKILKGLDEVKFYYMEQEGGSQQKFIEQSFFENRFR